MLAIAAPLLAAAAVWPETRTFWKPELRPHGATQRQVPAELLASGRHLLVYREIGYRFSVAGEDDERRQAEAAVRAFDERIYPRQVALYGPCPDLDGNDRVTLLITPFGWWPAGFFRFDQMPATKAAEYGFQSNQGEVLYHAFEQQGNRASTNIARLAALFHELLHFARDPRETSFATVLGVHSAYLSGVASPRALWAGTGPRNLTPDPLAPWTENAWLPLFLEYVRERFGEATLGRLVGSRRPGIDGLAAEGVGDPWQVLADFGLACWLDDPELGDGRFAFKALAPPRPPAAALIDPSRPTSGSTRVGVGSVALLLVSVEQPTTLPLSLVGDSHARWTGRAMVLRARGPDEEMPLRFDAEGQARIDLTALRPGDGLLIAAVPEPADQWGVDARRLPLLWGVGWTPEQAPDHTRNVLSSLSDRALGERAVPVRAALGSLLSRLSGAGAPPGQVPLITRYSFAPERADAVAALIDEAERRGLSARLVEFAVEDPGRAPQRWANVLIELPGSDERRWPVVIAAHYDASCARLDDSYLRALGLNDNASGVAVALETARAAARSPHRAPILIALLAGGADGAAGARALLDSLAGRVTAWIELDRVGIPGPWPRSQQMLVAGEERFARLFEPLFRELDDVGLRVRLTRPEAAGRPLVAGGPAILIHTEDRKLPVLPPEAEQAYLSPDLMALLVDALARGTARLAGTEGP